MARYDEDLHDNSFFIALEDKYASLYEEAAANCWVICIPRLEAAAKLKLTQLDMENHILIPASPCTVRREAEVEENGIFKSFNGKLAVISGDVITTKHGYHEPRQVKILFDEYFFNSEDKSYQVLCIDQPLEGVTNEHSFNLVALETLQDCMQFLWYDPSTDKIKRSVDSLLGSFKYDGLATTLSQKAAAEGMYERVFQEANKLPHVRKLQNHTFKRFYHLAVETYTLHCLHAHIFQSLCFTLEQADTDLNAVTHRLGDIHPSYLGVKQEFFGNIQGANHQLRQLNQFKSPLEKVNCFKQTVSALTQQSSSQLHDAVSADELLPLLVYLVLTTEIPNWRSNIAYIQDFHFSQVGSEEFLYYVTSFEAAVEYCTTGGLERYYGRDHWKRWLPGRSSRSSSINSSTTASSTPTPPSQIERFFQAACSGDIHGVEMVLDEEGQVPEEIKALFCHPLCSCRKCTAILRDHHDSSTSRVGVYSRDLLKRTALHYASLMGHSEVVGEFIKRKMTVDIADVNGHTPLHLACLRGNQSSVMLLLHDGAAINKSDKTGNTPLHLACSHGYEDCVKTLLFHSNRRKMNCEVNAVNNTKDTPLHLAARWGHAGIVLVLLEHKADSSALNAFSETPLDCAWAIRVVSLLKHQESLCSAEEVDSLGGEVRLRYPPVSTSGTMERSLRTSLKVKRRSAMLADSSHETERQMKKLFRAISDNDFQYVQYLFGWAMSPPPPSSSESDACHPLCQCDRCARVKKNFLTVNSSDNKGFTSLHKAAQHGRTKMVELLLKNGAIKDGKTKGDELTPMHLACQYNNKDVVMILLENRAELNPRDSKGNTPLHFCCNNGHMDSATLLMIHGADVTTANDRGDSPLHNAARWNHSMLVRELILYGALYSATNNYQRTPLDLTSDDEVRDVIERASRGDISVGEYRKQANRTKIPQKTNKH